jgi:hypothetical protein
VALLFIDFQIMEGYVTHVACLVLRDEQIRICLIFLTSLGGS